MSRERSDKCELYKYFGRVCPYFCVETLILTIQVLCDCETADFHAAQLREVKASAKWLSKKIEVPSDSQEEW